MKSKTLILLIFLNACLYNNGLGQSVLKTQIVSNTNNQAKLPYLTKDNKGNPVVCWTEKDSSNNTHFFYSISSDEGKMFSSPQAIPVTKTIKAHAESMPKVVFKKDGSIWAFFQTAEPGGPFSSNIRYTISRDEGKTWSSSKFISSDSTTGKSRSFFDVAVLQNGEIGIVYLGHKLNPENEGRPLCLAKTVGSEIGAPIVLDPEACECCRTKIFVEGNQLHIAYRDLAKGDIRDMAYVASKDGGKTFSSPIRISEDQWKIAGCPHAGPTLCSHDANVYAVWYTGKEGQRGVYYSANVKDKGFSPRKLISENPTAAHPQSCIIENKTYVVWDELVESKGENLKQVKIKALTENQSLPKMITKEGVNASFPVILNIGKSEVLVSWEEVGNDKSYVCLQKLTFN